MTRALEAVCLLLLIGCTDELAPVGLVEGPRLLAARVEVRGAADRATPAPGEVIDVRFLVAGPEGTVSAGLALEACAGDGGRTGIPGCAAPPFARAEQPAAALPGLSVAVPQDSALEAAGLLHQGGVVCAGGDGRFTGERPGCAGGEALELVLDLPLDSGETRIENPSLAAAELRLDGELLLGAPPSPCAALPRVAPRSESELEVVVPGEGEGLQISAFVTSGALADAFQVAERAPRGARATFRYRAPRAAAPGGAPVHLWVVARSSGGGTDFTSRAFCAAP